MRRGGERQPRQDKLASAFLAACIGLGFVLSPLDVFHWQIAERPSEILRILGLFQYVLGLVTIIAAMAANEFAAPTVHIQEAEGHKVADTGLYTYVRHPFCTGFLFMMIGTFLWLGTYFSLIVGTLMLGLSLAFRIRVEENTLIEELDGYKEYTEKVRARIIPYVI